MSGKFTVIVVDGEVVDLCEPYTSSLRYNDLEWEDAVALVRMSFEQGYQAVIWKIDEEGGEE